MVKPLTTYTVVDGDHVGYQVAGEGPDVLFLPSMGGSNVDDRWSGDAHNAWYRELATSCRMITLDRRGLGVSDWPSRDLQWEDWLADVIAVLDAAGSKSCTVFGVWEASPLALLLAATRPERVAAMVLFNPMVGFTPEAVREIGVPPLLTRQLTVDFVTGWGRDDATEAAEFFGVMTEEQFAGFRRIQRAAASPGAIRRLLALQSTIDARPLVPRVPVPVVLVDRPGWPGSTRTHIRWLLEHLPDARMVAVPGTTNMLHDEGGALIDVVRETAYGIGADESPNRELATVLFADVVGSTTSAEALGDRTWRQRLDAHDHAVGSIVRLNNGRIVSTTGDGVLALFEAPARALRAAASLHAGGAALLPLRIGIHTGEVERRGDDVAGIAVHVGARIGSLAAPGETLVSRTVRDLVAGSTWRLESRGRHELKGVAEEWELYSALPR